MVEVKYGRRQVNNTEVISILSTQDRLQSIETLTKNRFFVAIRFYFKLCWSLFSVSLRWTCSLESWCLTSSCPETASRTSLKSSEQGRFTVEQMHTQTKGSLIHPHNSWCKLDKQIWHFGSILPSVRQHFQGNKLKLLSRDFATNTLLHLHLHSEK